MFIVGLTGGIGSGKSAVAQAFREHGITVVDADQVAREVVEPGEPALAAIHEHFGDGILQADGSLDRAALRARVFQSPEERQWLEQQLHPAIRERMWEKLRAATSPYAILEAPLLLEGGQNALVQRVLVVDVPEDMQVARACQRDANSEAQIRAIMAAQISREARRAAAHDIIDNSGTLADLAPQVDALHARYLILAQQQQAGTTP